MEKRYEILIVNNIDGETYTLDLTDSTPVTLNYQVSDVITPGSINSSSTLPIIIPDTKNNRQAFGFISNISATSTLFNTTHKCKAYVLVSSVIVMEGYLFVDRIDVDQNNYNGYYECTIYADTTNFVKALDEKFLTDLSFSEYDHYWNISGLTASWNSDVSLGYYYPLVDNGYNLTLADLNGSNGTASLGVRDFYPATYVRTIWDKMFNTAGYTYDSAFLNADLFNNLLLLYNRDGLLIPPSTASENEFRAGYNNDFIINSYQNGTCSFKLEFDNVSPPNGDPFLHWNQGGTFDYQSQLVLTQTFVIDLEYNYYLSFQQGNSLGQQPWQLYMLRGSNPNPIYVTTLAGGPNGIGTSNFIPLVVNPAPFEYQLTSSDVFLGNTASPSASGMPPNPDGWLFRSKVEITLDLNNTIDFQPLGVGENVEFYLHIATQKFNQVHGNIITNRLGTVFAQTTRTDLYSYGSVIYNSVSTKIGPGSLIDYNSVLPQQVKQKDFFLWVCQMFNLYVEPSKTVANQLIIEPRNDYYNNGVIKNWTEKVDRTIKITEDILANTQAKTTFFKYKDDKDYLNTNYETKVQQPYAQYRLETDNQLTTAINTIELGFSPTPVASVSGSNIVIPQIYSYDQQKYGSIASNLRVVQRTRSTNGLTASANLISVDGNTFFGYPYVGMVDDINTPTVSIEFGQPQSTYYPSTTVTNNVLYDSYWRQQMEEVTDPDSRLVTMEIYLTPTDLNNFYFSDKIFIDNQYYKVNKISNYDPSVRHTSTVELIKTKDITIITKARVNLSQTQPIQQPGTLRTSSLNTNNGQGNQQIIMGNSNLLSQSSNNTIVAGNGNTITSGNSFINGNNNILFGNIPLLIGSGNSAGLGSSGVIIGNNITLTQSNAFVVNSDSITIGGTSSIINIVGTFSMNGFTFSNPTLAGVLANGNTTSGNNIIMSSSTYDKIQTPLGHTYILLNEVGSGTSTMSFFNNLDIISQGGIITSNTGGGDYDITLGGGAYNLTTGGGGILMNTNGGLFTRIITNNSHFTMLDGANIWQDNSAFPDIQIVAGTTSLNIQDQNNTWFDTSIGGEIQIGTLNSSLQLLDGLNLFTDISTKGRLIIGTTDTSINIDNTGITSSWTDSVTTSQLLVNGLVTQLNMSDIFGNLGNISASTGSISCNSNSSSFSIQNDYFKIQTPGTFALSTVHSRSGLNISNGYVTLYDRGNTNPQAVTLFTDNSNLIVTPGAGIWSDFSTTASTVIEANAAVITVTGNATDIELDLETSIGNNVSNMFLYSTISGGVTSSNFQVLGESIDSGGFTHSDTITMYNDGVKEFVSLLSATNGNQSEVRVQPDNVRITGGLLNLNSTSIHVNGTGTFTGTFSIGGSHIVTVTKGLITQVT